MGLNSTNDTWVGLDRLPYCSSTSFDEASNMLLEISNTLGSLGVDVNMVNAHTSVR